MKVSREKRIEKAQMRVLFTVPFFAPSVARLPVEFSDKVETAATDGQRILWNPKFLDSLRDEQVPTVLCHEAWHCLAGHIWRKPPGVDWDIWNQATDHAVNLALKEFSALLTSQGLADPFPFPDPESAYLADPKFKDMAEEKIAGILNNRPKGPGGQPGGQPGGRSPGGNQPPGSMPKFGEMIEPGVPSPDGKQPTGKTPKQLESDWGGVMQQSASMNKNRGSVPGSIARMVDKLVQTQLPWYELLRSWLREHAQDDWSWMVPNPLFDESGFVLPSLDSETIGAVVFAKDTSGSIDHDQLAKFVAEEQACLDEMNPRRLVDICCDSSIQGKVREYHPGDQISKDAPGGGGTSFRPVFDWCDKQAEPPKCVVYLTDMEGEFPSKDPGYPVIWVNYGSPSAKPPFGEVVNVQ